jgi:hypothetical protein
MQISRVSESLGNEEYALSKDLDVAMWLDYRNFRRESPLVDIGDFVIVNPDIHGEFDEFKKCEVRPACSFVPLTELLKFYCLSHNPTFLDSFRVKKFGKEYLDLKAFQVDDLVEWVTVLRKQSRSGDDDIFEGSVLQKVLMSGQSAM